MYYTIRTLIPEIFQKGNLNLENIKKVFDDWYMFYFPVLVNDVRRVYYVRPKRFNVVEPVSVSAVFFAMYEVRLREDFIVDDIFIFDMDNYSVGDVQKLTPTVFSNFYGIYQVLRYYNHEKATFNRLKFPQKVYALRLHKLIYLNCPSYMTIIVTILKTVLKAKLFARAEFYSDDLGIKKLFSKEVLPKEYGGDGPSLDELNGIFFFEIGTRSNNFCSDVMHKKLAEYQDRFDQLDGLRVDENLRPEKLNNDEILGYYGNFKKINFD